MRLAIAAAVALVLAGTAAGATPARWAGLSRGYVEAIATKGDHDYQLNPSNAVAPFHSLRAGTYMGRRAWIVTWATSCAGGHVPTMILSAGPTSLKPSSYDFVCDHARGDRVVCLEPVTC